MVAIVSGNSLGLSLTSMANLGQGGVLGTATQGQSGERAFVNVTNGNLVLQNQDDYLAAVGSDIESLRTYNSQGLLVGTVQDSWAVGAMRQAIEVSGAQLVRTDRDGARATYTGDAANGYVSTSGGGAYDRITKVGDEYLWIDGATGLQERYDAAGRIVESIDTDSQSVAYTYNAAGELERVIGANGETVTYRYDSGKLTGIDTGLADNSTVSKVSYDYDAGNRLIKVRVDLSPADGSIADGNVFETCYTYDGDSSRIASVTQGDGTSLAFTYGQFGGQYKVTAVTDGLLHVTSYDYQDGYTSFTTQEVEAGHFETQAIAVEPVSVQIQGSTQTGLFKMVWTAPVQGTSTSWRYRPAGDADAQWVTLAPQTAAGVQSVDLAGIAPGNYEFDLVETFSGLPVAQATGIMVISAPTVATEPVKPTTVGMNASGQPQVSWDIPAAGTTTTFKYFSGGTWYSLPVIQNIASGKQLASLVGDYDANGNLTGQTRYATQATVPPSAITTAQTLGDLRPASSEGDQVKSWTFDALGRVSTATDAQGTVTRYTYDAAGNVTTTDRALGTAELRTLQTGYDAQGRITSQTTAEGGVTTYTYDAAGRRISSTDANGLKTRFYYEGDGQLAYTINAHGEVTQNLYDGLDQLQQTVRYGTRVTGATLAAMNGGSASSVKSTIDALGSSALDSRVSYEYDLRGAVTLRTDELGNAATTQYNAFGEMQGTVERIDATTTVSTHYDYDRRGLRIKTTEDAAPGGLNRITQATYDAFGRIKDATDGRGLTQSYSYAHDTLGRLVVATTDALNFSVRTTYDAFGRVVVQTDGNGNATTTRYDDASRTMTVTTAEGVSVATTYDRHGQTVKVQDGRGEILSYHYDGEGKLTSRTSDTLGLLETRHYDAGGRLKDSVDANGVVTAYAYDAANVTSLSLTGEVPSLTVTTTSGVTMANVSLSQISAVR